MVVPCIYSRFLVFDLRDGRTLALVCTMGILLIYVLVLAVLYFCCSSNLFAGTTIALYTREIAVYDGSVGLPGERGNPGYDRLSWYQRLGSGRRDLENLRLLQTLGRQAVRGVTYCESWQLSCFNSF